MPTYRFGLAGDMHFGSAYQDSAFIKDFYSAAVDYGAACIYQVGDLLEGDYRHHVPQDLTAHGLDKQIAALDDGLPVHLPTKFILGNHDETLGRQGIEVGRYIAKGRKHLTYLGPRRAFVKHGKLKICLFHPRFPMAKSNRIGISPIRLVPTSALERFLCSVREKENPDIVAVGHWHQSAYFDYRGMGVFLCGAFQKPQGSFSNSLDSAPSVSSWLVEVTKTKAGRRVKMEEIKASY